MGNTDAPVSETQTGDLQQTEMVNTTSSDATSDASGKPSLDEALRELDTLRTALKKANAEAAGHRHKAKELDDLKSQIETEKLSEKERLEKRVAELQNAQEVSNRQHQERAINYEVRLQATQIGIIDTDAAVKLLDWSELEFNEDGSPSNVEELLKKLIKNKSYLLGKPANGSGGATNPSRSSSTGVKELTWAVITSMSAEEYTARRPEIQAWIAKNPSSKTRFNRVT